MCKVLNISRTVYYYKRKEKVNDNHLEELVVKIFKESRNNYGTRKIKAILKRQNITASRRRIAKIMAKKGLVSNYTVKQYKVTKTNCNEEMVQNLVNRQFDNRKELEVVVSDLTYVNVNNTWHFICILIDLHAREIIGYAAGKRKDATLVHTALARANVGLNKISIFHTDRGNEFKNKIIDNLLETFNITRSLSRKGSPYDNAVAEAAFKIFKTEFIFNRKFNSLEELERELFDYVNWYNNFRIHGSLGYLTPVEYKLVSI